jgi:hypothetical protein
MVILPKLAHFARTYPEIVLEIPLPTTVDLRREYDPVFSLASSSNGRLPSGSLQRCVSRWSDRRSISSHAALENHKTSRIIPV